IFSIHPVNVDTVAWISELKNTLSMFFYAAAILLYYRFDEGSRWRWYGLSLAAFLLALLSKTGIIMLPVVLLGCLWWSHNQLRLKDLVRTVPFFVLSLVFGLVTIWFQHHRMARGFVVPTTGLLTRLVVAGWTPWFYFYKALLPVALNVVYPKWDIDASRWVSYLPGALLVGCFSVFWSKRRTWGRPLVFALGYFVVTLFPVLGFFNQDFHRLSLVADHWQYQSMVGIIALVVAAGMVIGKRTSWRGRCLGVSLTVAVLAMLAVATWKRAGVYADSQTLWRDALSKNPNAWIAHDNLGLELCRLGRSAEGIAHYEQALRLNPVDALAHDNLGSAFAQVGRIEEAVEQFDLAVRLGPAMVDAHYNLGRALVRLGRLPEAIDQYEQTLRLDPDDADAHFDLGNALFASGNVKEAIGHWEEVVRIKPNHAEARNNLAAALAQAGRLQEAIEQFNQVVRITPDDPEAHFNLALALEQTGRTKDAMESYQQALRIRPDYPEARGNLTRLQARQSPAP
ncbi:MAG TPA: tetratricopeptide repeat protein, partial [Verrucomicrobiae bacterium]|nr:tetratricopeptide repeat protein [Verrucomicrobiae bacterium]